MYAGDYLSKNIGHEVINIMRADNDNHYIYINPYGQVNLKYYENIEHILLVRRSGYPNTLEIIAVASALEPCIEESYFTQIEEEYKNNKIDLSRIKPSYSGKCKSQTKKKLKKILDKIEDNTELELVEEDKKLLIKRIYFLIGESDENVTLSNDSINRIRKAFDQQRKKQRGIAIHKKQMEYISKEELTYQGKELETIFKNNAGNEYSIYTTFKAKEFIKLKEPIYITDKQETKGTYSKIEKINVNENIEKKEDKIKFPKQNLKRYIIKTKNSKVYSNLKNVIENIQKLDTSSTTEKEKASIKTKEVSFFEIIGKEYDELAFSNLFKYIFEKMPNAFCDFINNKLQINLNKNFKIYREKYHTDILIRDNKHIIVIENKIKSDINGSQLEDYYNMINGKKKHKNERENGYDYIDDENYVKEFATYEKNNQKFLLFAPEYNHIDEKEIAKNNFKLIQYSDKLSHYQKIKNLEKCSKSYFKEFLSAIEIHSYPVDNIQERQMFKRFKKRLESLR